MARISSWATMIWQQLLWSKSGNSPRRHPADSEPASKARADGSTEGVAPLADLESSMSQHGEQHVGYINGRSEMLPLVYGDRTITAIAPTRELYERLRTAVRQRQRDQGRCRMQAHGRAKRVSDRQRRLPSQVSGQVAELARPAIRSRRR